MVKLSSVVAALRKRKNLTTRVYMPKRARKARKVARVGTVRRMISSSEETKWSTFSATPAPVAGTPVDYVLNNLAKGDDRNTRTGNRIRMVSLQIRAIIQPAPVHVEGCCVRLIVFLDKQCNGAAPTFANLFSDPTAALQYLSPFNPNTVPSRFKILKDKRWVLNALTATATTPATGVVSTMSTAQAYTNIIIKLKKRFTQYGDGNAGTVADIIKPSLYMLWMTDAVATAPGISQEVVFRFKDA